MERVQIVGGGLAGCEAAWQLARSGVEVDLYEMRPVRGTEAHHTDKLAELVCSNSFRNASLETAVGLLKEEMRRLDSLIMRVADGCQVPAGSALAVDRDLFAEAVTREIERMPRVHLRREEVAEVPEGLCIIATGPLTSAPLGQLHASLTRQLSIVNVLQSVSRPSQTSAARGETSMFVSSQSPAHSLTPSRSRSTGSHGVQSSSM